jgi:hypothetical protein
MTLLTIGGGHDCAFLTLTGIGKFIIKSSLPYKEQKHLTHIATPLELVLFALYHPSKVNPFTSFLFWRDSPFWHAHDDDDDCMDSKIYKKLFTGSKSYK